MCLLREGGGVIDDVNSSTLILYCVVYTLVVESCPVEICPLFENPGNLKPGKNKP